MRIYICQKGTEQHRTQTMKAKPKPLFRKKPLKLGDEGPDVMFLSRLLQALGHNTENIIPIGVFGRQTEIGVIKLQESLNGQPTSVTPNGVFGKSTVKALALKGIDVRLIIE